jgi:hypothetical protein
MISSLVSSNHAQPNHDLPLPVMSRQASRKFAGMSTRKLRGPGHARSGFFKRNQSEPSPDTPIFGPERAEPYEISRRLQEFLKYVFRDRFVQNGKTDVPFPVFDDRKTLHNPLRAAD